MKMEKLTNNYIQINRAVIYCRVSTKEQAEDGNSLITQERICREYCNNNNYEVVQMFIEQGESAKTDNRTELKKLLAFCSSKKNKINVVVFYKIDRFSRINNDYGNLKAYLKIRGINIKSATETIEDTPAGRFMENVLASTAQFDNDVRTERSVNGMKEAMYAGRYVGPAPLGYDNGKIHDKSNIIPNETSNFIKEAFTLIAKQGYSAEKARVELTSKGFKTKNGKPLHKSQFHRTIKNEVYAGWICKFGERHKGSYEPIVSEELYNLAQIQLTGKGKKQTAYNVKNPDFPLRRFIFNNNGVNITGGWSKGRSKHYAYYQFKGYPGTIGKAKLEATFVTFLDSFKICERNILKLKQHINKCHSEKAHDLTYSLKDIKLSLDELDQNEKTLFEKNYSGDINDEILVRKYELIKQKRATLKEKLQDISVKKPDIRKILDFTIEYLKNPGKTWLKADFEGKQDIQWFNFPSGIIFEENKFRTTEIGSLLKGILHFFDNLSLIVPLKHQNLNQQGQTGTYICKYHTANPRVCEAFARNTTTTLPAYKSMNEVEQTLFWEHTFLYNTIPDNGQE